MLYVLLLWALLLFAAAQKEQEPKKDAMQIDLTQLPAPKPAKPKKQPPQPKAAFDPEVENKDPEGTSPKKPEKKPDKKPPKKQKGSKEPVPKQSVQEKEPAPKKPAKEEQKPEKAASPEIKPSKSGIIPINELNEAMEKKAQKQQDKKQQQAQSKQEQKLKQLYGDAFGELDSRSKQFLTTNIKSIQSITQRYLYELGYPPVAIKTRLKGDNIVEFTLHPNGDISGLKLIESSGYRALDDNSRELIEVAYKDYPLPESKTLIRIKVIYSAF